MSIDDFKDILDAFDPASLLPELEPVFERFAFFARIIVLVGPAALLVMGLVFLFAAPKEANFYIGYRCYYGMGSVEAWRYTQRLAGIVWSAAGLVLVVAMVLISSGFAGMQTMDLLWRVLYCVSAEAGLVAAACVVINTVVALRFDAKGNERRKKVRR